MLATPDDAARAVAGVPRPDHHGAARVGRPQFEIDTADRVYVGLNAEVIDHPGNASRLELGRRPQHDEDSRTVDGETFRYSAGPAARLRGLRARHRQPLDPTMAVYPTATEIRGGTTVHGNLILDGAALQFPDASDGQTPNRQPSVDVSRDRPAATSCASTWARSTPPIGGSFSASPRTASSSPALEISFPTDEHLADARPLVRIYGDLRIEGTVKSQRRQDADGHRGGRGAAHRHGAGRHAAAGSS